MAWSAFFAESTTVLSFLEHEQNVEDYLNTLETYILPYAYAFHGESFRSMQVCPSIHTVDICNEWFNALSIDVIPWAAKSSGYNPIENIRETMARSLYHGGKHYSTVEELKTAALECWHSLDSDLLKRLVSSMKGRCVQVIQKNDEKTSY